MMLSQGSGGDEEGDGEGEGEDDDGDAESDATGATQEVDEQEDEDEQDDESLSMQSPERAPPRAMSHPPSTLSATVNQLSYRGLTARSHWSTSSRSKRKSQPRISGPRRRETCWTLPSRPVQQVLHDRTVGCHASSHRYPLSCHFTLHVSSSYRLRRRLRAQLRPLGHLQQQGLSLSTSTPTLRPWRFQHQGWHPPLLV